jgi:hypothetical protein
MAALQRSPRFARLCRINPSWLRGGGAQRPPLYSIRGRARGRSQGAGPRSGALRFSQSSRNVTTAHKHSETVPRPSRQACPDPGQGGGAPAGAGARTPPPRPTSRRTEAPDDPDDSPTPVSCKNRPSCDSWGGGQYGRCHLGRGGGDHQTGSHHEACVCIVSITTARTLTTRGLLWPSGPYPLSAERSRRLGLDPIDARPPPTGRPRRTARE